MQFDFMNDDDDELMRFFSDPHYRKEYLERRMADVNQQLAEKGHAVSGSMIITSDPKSVLKKEN